MQTNNLINIRQHNNHDCELKVSEPKQLRKPLLRRTTSGELSKVTAIKMSDNGNFLAVAELSHGQVKVVGPYTGNVQKEMDITEHESAVVGMRWVPSGFQN